jgi:hypothetical protein
MFFMGKKKKMYLSEHPDLTINLASRCEPWACTIKPCTPVVKLSHGKLLRLSLNSIPP